MKYKVALANTVFSICFPIINVLCSRSLRNCDLFLRTCVVREGLCNREELHSQASVCDMSLKSVSQALS